MEKKEGMFEQQYTLEDLKEIVEESFDGIMVTDRDGEVLLVNQSYVRNTGIEKKELIGRNVKELVNPVWMKNSVALLAIEQSRSVSMHHTTKHGKNIIVTGRPIFDSDGQIKLVIVNTRDISEIYKLREEIIKLEEFEQEYYEGKESGGAIYNWNKEIVISCAKMRSLYALAKKVSNYNTTILITGESGVGKEMIARYIHHNGNTRKEKPFIAVNCGAIPENLLESELFGYVEGAFSGALRGGKKGIFEAASGGTLFLDEIGELNLNLQVKILRALEEKKITRVGDYVERDVDVRILAATNKNLLEAVEKGTFREDLYYRLCVVEIAIPPLRERKEEIIPLALQFINQFNSEYDQNKQFSEEVLYELVNYEWAGNIRQLRNVIENMVVTSNSDYIQLGDVPWMASNLVDNADDEESSLQEKMDRFEKLILTNAYKECGSSRKMAEKLNVDQSTVVRKMKKYGISKDSSKGDA